jgi:hypothetical protein
MCTAFLKTNYYDGILFQGRLAIQHLTVKKSNLRHTIKQITAKESGFY